MSLEIARGLSRASLLVLSLACLHVPTFGANPASYPGSVDNGNGTFTYVFRPSGGANNGADQGGLTTGKDTFIIHNDSPVTGNTNYGAADYAHHFNSTCNSFQGWSFFQWDVSALPAAGEVTQVTLVLSARITRAYGWPYQAPTTEFVLQAPMTAWNEMTMTYVTRPALDGTVLGRALLPTGATVAPNTWFDGLVRIDITQLYQEWRASTRPNFGVACRRPQAWCENANSTLVFTSDHADLARRPALEITYQGVAPDTTPPVITAPPSVLAEATSPQGATIGFGVSAFDDQDGPVPVVALPPSGSVFPLGPNTVTVTAKDAAGNTATGSFTITVRDTTKPVITSVTPSITSIWPPNKTMVPVTIKVVATDAVGIASAKIISVATNQPDRRTQWQITGPLTVSLLADRNDDRGAANRDRIYTITVEVSDAAGNVNTKTTLVTVPHDQRNGDQRGK